MKTIPNPELIDEENPEWTAEIFARARPASEVLPKIFGADMAERLVKQRGRPVSEITKKRITIRLSPDVVERFKQTGKGWQTRMDSALKDWLQHHPSV